MRHKRKSNQKQHFHIIVNEKKIAVLGLSEKTHFDKKQNAHENRLHIKTKIRGQLLPICALVKAEKEGVSNEYGCTWVGTRIAISTVEYIYRIDSKNSLSV